MSDIERDHQEARVFERIRLGQKYLFLPGLMRRRYLELTDIVWAYVRREDANATMCCGKVLLSDFYVVVWLNTGRKKMLSFEREENAQLLLDALQEQNPYICIGYTEEHKTKFGSK